MKKHTNALITGVAAILLSFAIKSHADDPVNLLTDEMVINDHNTITYDPLLFFFGNAVSSYQPTSDEIKGMTSWSTSDIKFYTPKNNPELPWDKLEAEALAKSEIRAPYTGVFIQNGSEVQKFHTEPDQSQLVSHPEVCWLVDMPSGFKGFSPMITPPSCASKWSTIAGYSFVLPVSQDNGAIDWKKYLKLYLYVFDSNNKLIGGADITNVQMGLYYAYSGFPVNSRYVFRAVVTGPGEIRTPPNMSFAYMRIYGY